MIQPCTAAAGRGLHAAEGEGNGRVPVRPPVLLALSCIGNATLSLGRLAGQGLDRVAPGRVLRNAGQVFSALLAAASVGNAGARPQSPSVFAGDVDAVQWYEGGERAVVESCISTFGASTWPQVNVLAHCLGVSAGNACREAVDPDCLTVLYRSVERVIPDLPEASSVGKQAPDFERAFDRLKRGCRQSDYYASAMVALEQAIIDRLGGSLASPATPYTSTLLREALESEMSLEDPMEIVGVHGRRLYAGIFADADRLYQMDPQWMDRAGRDSFQNYLEKRFPHPPRPGSERVDLSDTQVRSVLHELARFLNSKHPVG